MTGAEQPARCPGCKRRRGEHAEDCPFGPPNPQAVAALRGLGIEVIPPGEVRPLGRVTLADLTAGQRSRLLACCGAALTQLEVGRGE